MLIGREHCLAFAEALMRDRPMTSEEPWFHTRESHIEQKCNDFGCSGFGEEQPVKRQVKEHSPPQNLCRVIASHLVGMWLTQLFFALSPIVGCLLVQMLAVVA